MNRSSPPPRKQPPPHSAPRRPTAQRPAMTPVQKRRLSQQRKERRRRARRNFFQYALTALVFYFVFVLIAVGTVWIKLHRFPRTPVSEHDVFWADVEQDRFSAELKGTRYSKEDLLIGNDLYLSAELLSSYVSLSEGGNHLVRTLYFEDGEALFFLNSTTVCINGQYTSLSAPSLLRNGKLCLPLDFFTRCLSGLEISVDEEADRYVIKKSAEILFTFKEPVPEDSVSYESYLNLVKPD